MLRLFNILCSWHQQAVLGFALLWIRRFVIVFSKDDSRQPFLAAHTWENTPFLIGKSTNDDTDREHLACDTR